MSKIEWTGETWNPIIGCDKISAGCKNCYAIQTAWIRQHNQKMAEKYSGVVEKTHAGQLNWTGKVNLHEPSLLKPLLQKKPTTYFVNSMSDFFHPSVPDSFRDKMFAVMSLCPQHTFQILTKRHTEMLKYFKDRDTSAFFDQEAEIIISNDAHLGYRQEWLPGHGKHITNDLLDHLKQAGWYSGTLYTEYGKEHEFIYEGKYPLPNVWIGVSVEDQKAANERIPLLLQVPAAVRFLSCEPLLGPIEFSDVTKRSDAISQLGKKAMSGIDWLICGGESGKDARPMHPDWARSLRDQCQTAGVAFFFKQWGEHRPRLHLEVPNTYGPMVTIYNDGFSEQQSHQNDQKIEQHGACAYMTKVGKKAAGRLLDGREWNEMPVK